MSIRVFDDLYPADDPRDGTRILRFSHHQQATYEGVRNGVGAGQVTLRGTSSDGQAIAPTGMQYVRKGIINTAIVDAGTLSGYWEKVIGGYFFEEGDFLALDRKTLRTLTFGGASTLSYLDREVMWSHSYAHGIVSGFVPQDPFDGLWRLWNQGDAMGGDKLGAILWRVIKEGQAYRSGATYTHRHATGDEFNVEFTDAHDDDKLETAIPFVTLGFDQFTDSSGNAWSVISGEFEAQVGESLFEVTKRLMDAGLYVELDPDTFELRAWEVANHGRDRTGLAWGADVVRFEPPPPPSTDRDAGNILNDLKRALKPFIKVTAVLAGGGEDTYAVATASGVVPWHRFRPLDINDTTALSAAATRDITRRNDAGDTVLVRSKVGNDPANGYYLPEEHAKLDDLVTVHSGTDTWDWDEAAYPIAKWSVTSRRTGAPDVFYHLGASYHAGASKEFAGGAGVGQHTHPPNPRLCTVRVVENNPDVTLIDFDWQPSGMETVPAYAGLGQSSFAANGEDINTPGEYYWLFVVAGSGVFPDPTSQAYALAPCTPGEEIKLDWRARRSGTGTVTLKLRVVWLSGAFGSYSPISFDEKSWSQGDGLASYTNQTMTVTVPPGATAFYLDGNEGTGSWEMHDLEITELGSGVLVVQEGDGNEHLIGSSGKAKRCSDTEHYHTDRDPTVDDDWATGSWRDGTLWINESTGAMFLLVDGSVAGAADWLAVGGGADLSGINFLVGTASGDLSNEIVVGTTPGGELGGTWASPTVDATHAGSTHSSATDAHIADATDAHDASAISIADAGDHFTGTDVEAALQELGAGGGGSTSVNVHDLLTGHRFLVGAHRGDINTTDGYPENTLEGMRQAALKGAHWVEMDVRKSSDGTYYLMHDASVDRTTSGTGNVAGKTDAQMNALNIDGGLGYDSGRHGTSLDVPTLESVLDALWPYDVIVQFDNKVPAEAGPLTAWIIEQGWEHRAAINAYSLDERQDIEAVSGNVLIVGGATNQQRGVETPTYSDIVNLAYVTSRIPKIVIGLVPETEYGDPLDMEQIAEDMFDRGARGLVSHDIDAVLAWWRSYGVAAGVTDHGALTGLTDDDHTQYTRKATLTTTGDLYYASAASTPARRAIGTEGQVLKVVSGVPQWGDESGGNTGGLIPVDTGSVAYDTTTPGELGITVTSNWGHDGTDAYYDDTGATAGEEASLWFDPATGQYVVITFDFP